MNLQSYFHYTVFLIFLTFAIYTLISSRVRSRMHVLFGFLFLSFAVWSLSFAFINNPYVDKQVLTSIIDITSVANLLFAPLIYVSISMFTGFRNGEKIIIPLLIVYLILGVYFQLSGELAYASHNDNSFQYWNIDYANKTVTLAINLIHNTLIVISLFQLYRFINASKNKIRKKQGKIILITGLISFSLAFLNIHVSNWLEDLYYIPYMPDFFLLILASGILYSIIKLRLFEISPFTVADKIVELIPAGLFLTDENDRIITVNRSLLNLTGYRSHELIGKKAFQWFKNLNVEKSVDFQCPEKNQRIQIKSKNNFTYDVYISSEMVYDDNQKIRGTIYVLENITELINAQNELTSLNSTLEEKVKTRTAELEIARLKAEESDQLKSAFLKNMSHEIRTPMNGILGFSQLLQNDKLPEEKKQNYISFIITNGQHLLSIVNDIIDISMLETGEVILKHEPVCINELIMSVFTKYYEQSQNKNLEFLFDKSLNNAASTIYSDNDRIRQILDNLLNNALKFTSAGSISFGYEIVSDYMQFFVKDSGIGIEATAHQKIFEYFRQVELGITRQFGGTGLGLSISKKLVELMGGSIWLDSIPNQGTTFYFSLPYKPVQCLKPEIES